MSDAGRSTTTLDIKVNARELTGLDKKLGQTFAANRTQGFSRGIDASAKAMRQLIKATQQVTEELVKQRRASDQHFTEMAQGAQEARREVSQLRAELERLRASGPPGGGTGGSAGGMPGSQGGAGYGGWRGAPQVGIPDASSIATAMSSIPFLGLAAGGATMASYQMYGSALGYQTARRDTFSALGPQGAQMLRLRQTQKASGERIVTSGDPGQAYSDGLNRVASMTDNYGIGKGDIEGLYKFYSGFDNYVYDTGTSSSIRKALVGGANAAGHKTSLIPAQEALWNAPMSTGDLEAIGMSHGVKPGDALREAAGLSGAMGRRASAGSYDFARSAQTYFGADMGVTGGLMKGFRVAGGLSSQDGQADAVAQLIGSAVARGLENSEIAAYLQSMSGFLQKAADMGQQEQMVTGLTLTSERLKRTGFGGQFATSYAMQLGQAGSQMGYGAGAADPVKFMLLQQLGYGKGGNYTAESYAEAMLKLQDGDMGAVAGLGALGSMSDSMRGSGMSPAVRALMMSRLTGAMGAQVGPDGARLMAGGIAGRGFDDPTTTAGDIRRIHAEAGGSTVGILAGEAGMEAGRIQAGFKAADQVQAMNGVMIDLANTAQNIAGPALDMLTSKLKGMSEAAASWDPRGGSGVGSAGKK